MTLPSRDHVDENVACALSAAQAADAAFGNRPDCELFEDLWQDYQSDPTAIDAAFRIAARLDWSPDLPSDCRYGDIDYDWLQGNDIPEDLELFLNEAANFSNRLAVCAQFHHESPLFSDGFRAFVRRHRRSHSRMRLLAHEPLSDKVFGFATAHEAAEWWVRQFSIFSKYHWASHWPSTWFYSSPQRFFELNRKCMSMVTKLAGVNLEHLSELINDEAFRMAATLDGRTLNRVDGIAENEWLTPPLEGLDISGPFNVFENVDGFPQIIRPDSAAAEIVYPYSSSGDHQGSNEAHTRAHQKPDHGAPIKKNGESGKKMRVFDNQCKTLLRRWIRAMEKSGKWIPRKKFFREELPVLQAESPNTWLAEWKPRRFHEKFKDNAPEWKPQVAKWDPERQ